MPLVRSRAAGSGLRSESHCREVRAMLASMASFTLPNPALVRTVRLRRPSGRTAFALEIAGYASGPY